MRIRPLGLACAIVVACGCGQRGERERATASEPVRSAEQATTSTETESPTDEDEASVAERTTAELEAALQTDEAQAEGRTSPSAQTLEELAATLGCDPTTAARISEREAEVLGMLDEYISRFDYYSGEPHPLLIERFYPHERAAADAFEQGLRATFARRRAFTRQIGAQGHISFEGQEVADAINAMYVRVPPAGASIDACKALGWSDAAARSYLRGMRARFTQSGRTLTMANAGAKMAFAAALARKLGLTIDAYYTTDTIPTGYYLTLTGLD